uniref:Uncharacterized protein n=1 Tax=viral metagenome TaxID=1070528 RepID=A0A6H1ZDI7_9ZZZZ
METIDFEGEKRPASYLGDGVYVIHDGYGIWLHANDHKNPTDKIYLEPSVLEGLNNFNRECIQLIEKEEKGERNGTSP